jgi:hypothetical protein
MTYHPDPIPLETLFSSWVFLWAILYLFVRIIFPQINTKWVDPTFAILLALTYQFYALISILFRVNSISKLAKILVKFAIITILFKLLPLYFVWNHVVNWMNSVLSCSALFSIYIAFITNREISLFEIYDDLTDSFVTDDDRIQFEYFAKRLSII